MMAVDEYIAMNSRNLLYDGDFIDRDDEIVSEDVVLIWWDDQFRS